MGRRLATRLQMKFVDTDDLIEEWYHVPIIDIVNSYGWNYFRTIEKRIIGEISNQDHLIIASGGGTILDPENVTALNKNGLIIWLKADGEVIRRRLEEDSRSQELRPTLTGKGTLEELEEVMNYRDSFYKKASGVQLDTSTLDVDSVVENILSIVQEQKRRN